MSKKSIKICLLVSILTLTSYSLVYATEQDAIGNILNSILSVLTWIAYAIAIGFAIYIGIKYVIAPADEKARLKGVLPKYLLGIALIVFCFTIASMFAKISGNNSADEVIDVGKEAGEHFPIDSGGTPITSEDVEDITGTCPSNNGGKHITRAGSGGKDADGRKWYDVSCQNCGQHWRAYEDEIKK